MRKASPLRLSSISERFDMWMRGRFVCSIAERLLGGDFAGANAGDLHPKRRPGMSNPASVSEALNRRAV
jgi:hypothetical protein